MQILKTERLILREIQLSDAAMLAQVLSDPLVMKYSTKGMHSEAQIQDYILDNQSRYKKSGFGQWIVATHTSDFVGICGLNEHQVDDEKLMHLMYRLASKQQGKGYATEAVNGVVSYVFSTWPDIQLHTLIEPSNIASINVAQRAGFKFNKRTVFGGVVTSIYQYSQK